MVNRKSEIGIRTAGQALPSTPDVPFPTERNMERWNMAYGTANARGLTPPGSLDAMSNNWRARRRLLEFDRGAGSFEVLLELLGIFLRSRFLHDAAGLGEVLG